MTVSSAENVMVYQQKLGASNNIHVEDYASLVKRIAHHMMARMPSSVQVDDLIQAGMIGLIEAAQKYDGEKGASFETYAGIRIRGAIVDEMRRGDWAPRSVHRNSRRVTEAMKAVEMRVGRDAKDVEIAEEMEVSLGEYYDMVKDASSTRLFSFEEVYDDNDNPNPGPLLDRVSSHNPSADVHDDALRSALVKAIDNLPEREKLVLSLYYEQELNLKEIGLVLEVSESRVSQIHSQATARLRTRMGDWSQ